MPSGQLSVGDGDDPVGVVLQLVQGDLIVRAQHVAQKVYDQGVLPYQLRFHGRQSPFLCLSGGGGAYASGCSAWAAIFAFSSSSSTR